VELALTLIANEGVIKVLKDENGPGQGSNVDGSGDMDEGEGCKGEGTSGGGGGTSSGGTGRRFRIVRSRMPSIGTLAREGKEARQHHRMPAAAQTAYVGRRVSKVFGEEGAFEGTVHCVRWDHTEGARGGFLFWVRYDDGDEEELSEAGCSAVLLPPWSMQAN